MNFKLIATGVAALSMLATSFAAQAADMPVKGYRPVVAYYNWTGLYAGINAGYGFGNSNWDIPAVSPKPKGFLGGLTLGYNYQIGSTVWGIEGDIDYSDVKGSSDCGIGGSCETRNRWLGTVRGRLGYAFDRWMPYVTGGAAFGDVKATSSALGLTANKTKIGWTAGAGLEYAFLGNWTAKIEYLYVDLGKFDTGFAAPLTDNVSFQESIIRAGVNYKFSGPVFARY